MPPSKQIAVKTPSIDQRKRVRRPSLIRKLVKVIFIALIVALALFFWHQNSIRTSIKTSKWFTEEVFQAPNYAFFDLGVVDANNDANLDVFTDSHLTGESALLLNDGSGKFTNVLSEWKLNQSQDFPGIGDRGEELPIDAPGYYLYWRNGTFVIRGYRTDGIGELKGQIKVSAPVFVKDKQSVKAKVTVANLASGAKQTAIDFTMQNDGQLAFKPKIVALPISFTFNESLPLNSIYVGAERKHPSSHNFVISMRDRHGMAWADYDGDGKIDVFISRGGLMGTMERLNQSFSDELLQNIDSKFEDQTAGSGIVKNSCPGYQVAWVDFNNDNLLDLYVSCERGHPNQFYQQQSPGKFIDVATQLGLDSTKNSSTPFAWLDVDNDGDMDLLFQEAQALLIYENKIGRFDAKLVAAKLAAFQKLAIADYDRDGDLDVFGASNEKNVLLVNNQGNFSQVNPEKLGLPAKSKTANWVDFDDDGLLDLYAVPGSLYHQRADRTFERTRILEHASPTSIDKVRCAWFDIDNNGTQDLLMAARYYHSWWFTQWQNFLSRLPLNMPQWVIDAERPDQKWNLTLYRNFYPVKHWLQVNLVGLGGNQQAIGARVLLKTSKGQTLKQVGEADGSHYSQGHYRLYFGLGNEEKPEEIEVFWSNAQRQVIKNPGLDQLLTIRQAA
jgi:ASPIC and UnbV/FG-GAP-like repeat